MLNPCKRWILLKNGKIFCMKQIYVAKIALCIALLMPQLSTAQAPVVAEFEDNQASATSTNETAQASSSATSTASSLIQRQGNASEKNITEP